VCVREARQAIVDGKKPVSDLLSEKVGEIKATILERDGKILMVKDCPLHGHFEDVMAIDTAFFRHLEEMFPGSDIVAHNDEKLHNHGSSTIRYGRGAVLTVDLTNRCNMMCDPCFMDANQVGFVHGALVAGHHDGARQRRVAQAAPAAVGAVLRRRADAVALLPRRGPLREKVGYNSVQAATNGIEFAKSPEFCKAAAEAGLALRLPAVRRIGNAANSHRLVGNLFDVKLRAIETSGATASTFVPVITIVNGVKTSRSAASSSSRSTTREDQLPLVPARVVHGPRRGGEPTAAGGAALTRCRT